MDDKNNINGFDDQHKGLDVPKDYFESLAARIREQVAENDELRKIAPTLAEIPKYNPFIVPDGYFDELPALIQEKVIESGKVIPLKERFAWIFRPQMAIAAAITLLIIIAAVIMRNNSVSEEKVNVPFAVNDTSSSPEDTSIHASEEFALYSVDEATLIESVEGEEIAQATISDEPSVSNEDIETYLVENNIDVTSIINEL
jgi:hypothetical protein